jgi:hypothetical protein
VQQLTEVGRERTAPVHVTKGSRRKIVAVAMGLAVVVGTALPSVVASATPTAPFTQCPAVGRDTSCGTLITINSDGSATVSVDPTQPSMNPTDGALVGVVNDSSAIMSSIALSGTGIFAFDGHGLCAAVNTPCLNPTEYGPTGYEGPGTSFSVTDASDGTLNFPGGFYPGKSTYFSLETSPFTVGTVNLGPGISLSALPITGVAGVAPAPTVTVASFTDGYSTADPTEFTATIAWGDGDTTTGMVSQLGGSGNPYQVTGSHTYATKGTYPTTITVTDSALPLINTAMATGSASVTVPPISAAGVTIGNQKSGKAFTVGVATFTDANPGALVGDFTASIQWGDGGTSSGTITQPGLPGTVFDVAGTHTYAASGSFTVAVTVSDGEGSNATVTDMVSVANAVIKCAGTGCSGSFTTPTESLIAQSTSTTGIIYASLNNQGTLSCGDPFDHAPQITTITDTGLGIGAVIHLKVKFLRADLVGPPNAGVEVCYESNVAFTELEGQTVLKGLLPTCASVPARPRPKVGPCYKLSMNISTKHQTISESLLIPSGDPKNR